ncbi:type IV secretory pathway VirD2 relaxase [Bradyrhizobium sp. CIR48]|uniref:relaxase/mobilization nuclease RlxS n=1 Tax=unclassified Bradyrhizobium TaxID=2631580 RepID=UPI001605634D|nr:MULTISPECIES: relaxase/mobilization nuclease RlxS [unclassified Bradyrhizobium]MBB4360645.1 type IV secretory pathway VirD2 relaxase [Bradyrhizobium sp. CIR18]MBB4429558.1 type IV secretory pathway VirD2 relaxase [Bradyrhizobium sp. CIR48]
MREIDDEFDVKFGRIGNRKARRSTSYLRRVRQEATKAGASARASSSFTGSRIGRGHAQGAVLAGRARSQGQRRVVIKARIVRIKSGNLGAVRAHLRYVQRDGVTREGEPGDLYDGSNDRADGKSFTERSAGDRHQFRFIVAPEDSVELADLKPFVRDLMQQMEQDLGTRLDWVAADHFNTGHPHTHIVLRGKDDRGDDLVIARDYIAHGFRSRAAELITRELGPETEIEVARKLQQEVTAERLTRLDRSILQDAAGGVLELGLRSGREPAWQTARIGRLRTLERMGLAEESEPGHWRIDPELEPRLRRMGERGDIIKTMHREMAAAGISRAAGDYAIFDPEQGARRLVGRVVSEGFADELTERRYVVIDGVDGRTHYAEIGAVGVNDEPPVRNTVLELRSRVAEPRAIDRTIAEIAARHGGSYSDRLHREFDPQASGEFVGSHVRRLEAMRREGMVSRLADGSWGVGKDYLDRAHRYEQFQRSRNPVRVTVLSWQRLEDLPQALGATWLDRKLVGKEPDELASTGFGAEVETALRARRQWLIEQGLAREEGGQVRLARSMLETLQARELARTAADISARTGLEHVDVKAGDKIDGVYRRMLTLNSGRFALIERSHEFALVPWRPVLDRARGQLVSGQVGGEGISWSIGIKRGIGL